MRIALAHRIFATFFLTCVFSLFGRHSLTPNHPGLNALNHRFRIYFPAVGTELHGTYSASSDHLTALERALSGVAAVFGRSGGEWRDAAREFAFAHGAVIRLIKVGTCGFNLFLWGGMGMTGPYL